MGILDSCLSLCYTKQRKERFTMQSKRFLAIAALCAMVSLSVTGCGSDSSAKDSAAVTIAATTATESTTPASSADSEATTTADTASETADASSDTAETVVATYDNNLETYEFEVPEDGTYTFTDPVSADDVFWDIYVLDAQWNDGVRYIKQSQDANGQTPATLTLKKGQWVYCFCSQDGFSTDEKIPCNLTITKQ